MDNLYFLYLLNNMLEDNKDNKMDLILKSM